MNTKGRTWWVDETRGKDKPGHGSFNKPFKTHKYAYDYISQGK